jgi:hypothetical protein
LMTQGWASSSFAVGLFVGSLLKHFKSKSFKSYRANNISKKKWYNRNKYTYCWNIIRKGRVRVWLSNKIK